MPQIELTHPDASAPIRVPASQKEHFKRLGWTPEAAPQATDKTLVKQPVKGKQNGKS